MEGSAILIPVARQHPSLISSTKVSPERARKRERSTKEGRKRQQRAVNAAVSSGGSGQREGSAVWKCEEKPCEIVRY